MKYGVIVPITRECIRRITGGVSSRPEELTEQFVSILFEKLEIEKEDQVGVEVGIHNIEIESSWDLTRDTFLILLRSAAPTKGLYATPEGAEYPQVRIDFEPR